MEEGGPERSGSIADRCPASIRPRWTTSSSRPASPVLAAIRNSFRKARQTNFLCNLGHGEQTVSATAAVPGQRGVFVDVERRYCAQMKAETLARYGRLVDAES